MADRPGLLQVARGRMRTRHQALRTEQAYLQWIRRYVHFHQRRHPRDLGAAGVEQFFTHLAVARKVRASTRNDALLVAELPYGSGLRVAEALRLRLKDVVPERGEENKSGTTSVAVRQHHAGPHSPRTSSNTRYRAIAFRCTSSQFRCPDRQKGIGSTNIPSSGCDRGSVICAVTKRERIATESTCVEPSRIDRDTMQLPPGCLQPSRRRRELGLLNSPQPVLVLSNAHNKGAANAASRDRRERIAYAG